MTCSSEQMGSSLEGLHEDLKGKTQLKEPYVDKNTLVRIVREQNKVMMELRDCLMRMEAKEKQMLKSIDALELKVSRMQKYQEQVEDLLSHKIPLVDKMNGVLQQHDSMIDTMSTQMKEEIDSIHVLKRDAKNAENETKDAIVKLQEEVHRIPDEITISSHQVRHSQKHQREDTSSSDQEVNAIKDAQVSNVMDGRFLDDIIEERQDTIHLHEVRQEELEQKLHKALVQRSQEHVHLEESINSLVKWKTDQSNVNLVTIRENHDEINSKLHGFEKLLSAKVSKKDFDKKLQIQREKIIEYLNEAMAVVENDENDFRSITENLQQMIDVMNENKAEKKELTSLRQEFIQYRVHRGDCDNYNEDAPWGYSIDNEDIRQLLTKYTTVELVERMIEAKLDRETAIPRFEEIEGVVHKMKQLVNEIIEVEATRLQSRAATCNVLMSKTRDSLKLDDNLKASTERPSKVSVVISDGESKQSPSYTSCDVDKEDVSKSGSLRHIDKSFSSSSAVIGPIGHLYRSSKVAVVIDNNKRSFREGKGGSKDTHDSEGNVTKPQSVTTSRPISANRELDETHHLPKRQTLPALMTTSKTMSPRPKSGSKIHCDIARSSLVREKPSGKMKQCRQSSVVSNTIVKRMRR